jgi:DHA2 family multidrug resistance protein-like MFS transporter
MTPWPLVIIIVAPLAGILSDRYPAGLLGGIGLVALGCGLLALALLPSHPDVVSIAWRMALCGLGFGLFQSPNNRAILSSAPPERSGGASGMLGTARLMGQTIGAALVALIFNLFADNGTVAALVTAACFAFAAAILSTLRLTRTVTSRVAVIK